MGYRSDVGIAVRRYDENVPDIPTLLALAKTKGIIGNDYFEKEWGKDSYGWDDDNFTFYVESIKWYEDDPSVKAMERLFAFFEEVQADHEDSAYSGVFCRVGEETTDVTEETFGDNWYDLMSIRTVINFDDSFLGRTTTAEIKR